MGMETDWNQRFIENCRYRRFVQATELLQQGTNPNFGDNWLWKRKHALHYGCAHGNLEFVKLLIESYGCDTQVRDENQHTPLHFACQHGHLHIAQYLINDRDCDPEVRNDNEETPLCLAFQNSQMRVVQFLITQQNYDPNFRIDIFQQTLLHCACQDGHLDIVQYLISERSCSLNVRDRFKQTPLFLAYQNKHMEIVQFHMKHPEFNPDDSINTSQHTLLHCTCQDGNFDMVQNLIEEHRCNPEVRDSVEQTPLHYACQRSDLDIVRYLISKQGCDPGVRNADQQIPLHYSCCHGHLNIVQYLVSEQGCNPEVTDKDQRTPLHYACKHGHLPLVEYLVNECGCDPNATDIDQSTPVHLAYQCNHMEIVHFLIRQPQFNPHLKIKQTLLDCACKDGNVDIADYLICERGYDTKVRDVLGNAPLHYAAGKNSLELIKLLMSKTKSNPNWTNNDGDTALHIACRNNYVTVAKFLIQDEQCNPDKINHQGETALHIVCKERFVDLFKFLIKEGNCNPDLANSDGDTALHISVRFDNSFIRQTLVKGLLEGKCNPNLKNSKGETPLDLTNQPKTIKELIRHGANPTKVYETHGKIRGLKQPLQPLVKVFVIGNASVGKSTLTAALKKEASLVSRTFTLRKKVSGVDEKTAGVIPHDFVSKKCGPILLYDFAGHIQYHSSHAASLQNAIHFSPPIFLLVVDLCERNDEMEKTILYWLSFIENQCATVSSKPHLIIVGSHADILKSRGENPKQKRKVLSSLQETSDARNLSLCGFIVLDCQYSESTGMTELRQCLKKSCDSLRHQDTINVNAHCFFVYLIDKFKSSTALTVKEILMTIQTEKASAEEHEPLFFLPISPSALCGLCDELNESGHILFLKNQTDLENSWVIVDTTALLSEVISAIFAPEGYKQHCKFSSSTGVVSVSDIAKIFPHYNLEMLVGVLSHLEFCHEITDQDIVLQLTSEQHHVPKEGTMSPLGNQRLLFPALICLDTPSNIWEPTPDFKHQFGWLLECSEPGQSFSFRFLHVLLLRLVFSFVSPLKKSSQKDPTLQPKCSLWKNGIFWGNRGGVETLVEEVQQHKTVIILMRCAEQKRSEYFQLRSSVIQQILKLVKECCVNLSTIELFIDPAEVKSYPLKSASQLMLFSVNKIAEAIVGSKSSVVSTTGQTVSLDSLVTFEPYTNFGEKALRQLFGDEYHTIRVSDKFLSHIATEKSHLLPEVFNFPGQCDSQTCTF